MKRAAHNDSALRSAPPGRSSSSHLKTQDPKFQNVRMSRLEYLGQMELLGKGQDGAIGGGAGVDAQAGCDVAIDPAVPSGSAHDGELRDLRKTESGKRLVLDGDWLKGTRICCLARRGLHLAAEFAYLGFRAVAFLTLGTGLPYRRPKSTQNRELSKIFLRQKRFCWSFRLNPQLLISI